jgi:peptidoglycan/LPS O-acetylase OafA/YrhL
LLNDKEVPRSDDQRREGRRREGGFDGQKILPLTSIRFLAALAVVFYHSAPSFWPMFPGYDLEVAPRGVEGYLFFSFTFAISFFFLLSGYILARVYLRDGEPLDVRAFFVARFARFYPVYALVMVLAVPELVVAEVRRHGIGVGAYKSAKILIANLALLQSWVPERLLRFNAPSWTLCVETFFYLCFPWLGLWIWRLKGQRLWLTAFGVYAAGQAMIVIARPHMNKLMVLYLPLLHLSTFAMGILLARWQTLEQRRRQATSLQANVVLVISMVGVFLAVLLIPHFFVPGIGIHGLPAPAIAGIIWALSAAPTAIGRWLSAGWLVNLGEGSLALYLVHYPVLILFYYLRWNTVLTYPVYLAICIAISVLSVRYFETPTRRWLLRWAHTRTRETVAAASIAQ